MAVRPCVAGLRTPRIMRQTRLRHPHAWGSFGAAGESAGAAVVVYGVDGEGADDLACGGVGGPEWCAVESGAA